MPDLPTIGWLLAVAGGALILGIAIAYGMNRSRKVSAGEREQSERATHEIYEHEKDA